mgnify:CR=1 FL=1
MGNAFIARKNGVVGQKGEPRCETQAHRIGGAGVDRQRENFPRQLILWASNNLTVPKADTAWVTTGA